MISLENENGDFVLSQYGQVCALGFRGDLEFIERGYNLAINFGMTKGQLHKATETMSYVVTTQEKILKALQLYYYCQTIRNKEIPIECNEENDFQPSFDEAAAEKLALEKAENFFNNKIITDNFMFPILRDRARQTIGEYQFSDS